MNEEVLTYNGGRLGNQLYYILQSYIRNSKYRISVNNTVYDRETDEIKSVLCLLNCGTFLTDEKPLRRVDDYCQNIDFNFTIGQLESFVTDVLLNSQHFNEKIKGFGLNEDDLCLYIGCGDCLAKPYHNCFDRIKYLNNSFDMSDGKFKRIVIVSDDIEYCKNNYLDYIKPRFEQVVLHEKQSILDDFIYMCSFKNKIIWNSTFSIWSAFISNVLFENSYENVICPDRFHLNKDDFYGTSRYNPKWKMVKTSSNVDDSTRNNVENKFEFKNVVSNNCIGAYMYSYANRKFDNPFMWSYVRYDDFLRLIREYDKIDFGKYEIQNYYTDNRKKCRIVIDGKITVCYPHYIEDRNSPVNYTLREHSGRNIYVQNVNEYVEQCYLRRIRNMDNDPIFVLSIVHGVTLQQQLDFVELDCKYRRILVTNNKDIKSNCQQCNVCHYDSIQPNNAAVICMNKFFNIV